MMARILKLILYLKYSKQSINNLLCFCCSPRIHKSLWLWGTFCCLRWELNSRIVVFYDNFVGLDKLVQTFQVTHSFFFKIIVITLTLSYQNVWVIESYCKRKYCRWTAMKYYVRFTSKLFMKRTDGLPEQLFSTTSSLQNSTFYTKHREYFQQASTKLTTNPR